MLYSGKYPTSQSHVVESMYFVFNSHVNCTFC